MKKIISLALVVVFALSAVLTLASCGKNKSDDTIIIGVYEPATGANGAGGKQETLGVEYANSVKNTVTVGGKTYNVKLEIVDNESSDATAVTAATTLINKGASVVLGSYGSSVSIAASDTFKNAGLAAIGITCTNPNVTLGNDHYFRACFLDPFQGTVLANYAKAEGATKALLLGETGNAYDIGLVTVFKEAFGAANCSENLFQPNTTAFSSYITTAIEDDYNVIFAPTSIQYAQQIIAEAQSQGYAGLILAGDTWDSNVITEAATGSSLNIQVTTFYQEGANTTFDTGFATWLNADSARLAKNGGNTMISAVSAMGYDTYMTALYAIEHANVEDGKKPTKAQIKASLASMTTSTNAFEGVTGSIYFDTNGDCVRDAAFIKKVNTTTGAWTFVKKQTSGTN